MKLFGFEFETDGNSGGLTYEVSDAEALVKKLKASGHFGEDGALMGLMHPGQKSNREWANDPGDPRGLHLSTGAGATVDAHIDKQAPVGKPVDGKTTVDPRQAYKHGTQELIPEAVRKKLGGLPIKPTGSIEANKEGWHGVEAKVGLEVELRGPVEKKKPNLRGPRNAADPAPEEIQARIATRVSHTNARFPISVGTRPDEVPENAAFATVLAATVMEAARGGEDVGPTRHGVLPRQAGRSAGCPESHRRNRRDRSQRIGGARRGRESPEDDVRVQVAIGVRLAGGLSGNDPSIVRLAVSRTRERRKVSECVLPRRAVIPCHGPAGQDEKRGGRIYRPLRLGRSFELSDWTSAAGQ